jgi:mycoredoxin
MEAAMNDNAADIVVYTTRWCPACWRAKQLMKSMKVGYKEIDISFDQEAVETVMRLNRGYRSVPTIVFPDGSHLTEPHAHVLKTKLEPYA